MTCGMMTCEMNNGDRMKFVFSPDVILCGWLGSKHQLANNLLFVSFPNIECNCSMRQHVSDFDRSQGRTTSDWPSTVTHDWPSALTTCDNTWPGWPWTITFWGRYPTDSEQALCETTPAVGVELLTSNEILPIQPKGSPIILFKAIVYLR